MDGAGGKRGKGASSLGLDVYRDFMKGKKGSKGSPSIDKAQDSEGAPNLDDAEYEEEVEEEEEEKEEEEVVAGEEASVEVELEVMQEEEWNDDPSVAENVAVPETEEAILSETAHEEDGQAPISEPEVEEGYYSEAMASSGATGSSTFITEENPVFEEHD